MNKDVLAVIIGRAGSKGLPGKNERAPAGVPMVAHTIEHAKAARRVSRIVVSTDGPVIAAAARAEGIEIVDRPPRLASDSASVADVVRHAAARVRTEYDVVVVLYANVPVRPADLIDAAVDMLLETGADSVQSYCDVRKSHPWWMVSLDDAGRVRPFIDNEIDRRQDLPKLLIPDGGVIAVTRRSLFHAGDGSPHDFLGRDRRGIETTAGAVVDIDTSIDLVLADAILRRQDAGTLDATG